MQILNETYTVQLISALHLKYDILKSMDKSHDTYKVSKFYSRTVKLQHKKFAKDKRFLKSLTLFGESNLARNRKLMLKNLARKWVQLILREVTMAVSKLSHRLPAMAFNVHMQAQCDFCNQSPILYSRYKCKKCWDFDFCGECYKTRKLHHFEGNHEFSEVNADFGILYKSQ